MSGWELADRDLKKYPHFDPLIPANEAMELATDPSRVARHTFYPFMRFTQRWNRFAGKGEQGKPKSRQIRYAARRDAYIFSYYRFVLSERYEAELKRLGLSDSILAYRRIPDSMGDGGKCNIHFARDAFLKIREFRTGCAIALDISGFFENLDHEKLKKLWCRMLDVRKLPPDHFQVFKAITNYAVVDKQKAYERLGHFGTKRMTKFGKPVNGYLTPYKKIPKQLCSGKQFRELIVGSGQKKTIIEKNYKPYGIPQGAPISDLLANLYLLDFDVVVAGWVGAMGGAYYRYSDDILIVVPGGEAEGSDIMDRVQKIIGSFGDKLAIKDEKSSAVIFEKNGEDQSFRLIRGFQGKNGLEYLGFRYDGKRAFIRDSTLSNLNRKIVRAARRAANENARRYSDKSASEICALFNFEAFTKRFGRIEEFNETEHDYRKWTFWTYARKASKVFGPLGSQLLRQLRHIQNFSRNKLNEEFVTAVYRRDNLK